MPHDPSTQADIDELVETLQKIATDFLDGRGFAIGIAQVWDASKAGKRLAGKDGAGKDVLKQFLGRLVTERPEVIDVAFAGLGELTKAKIRKVCGGPEEIKQAEQV